ncbi:MaoC/PaaZ C-terminal domain-containing protein [uncultured Planococcus sp.]|uniref:MaoC/PaaZ C-terminal domain-containing protein n=1 Tax=uncultured Planococcus sp. TaxID=337815 RepID=UPI0026336BC9|nr:MaoC/PaaZ C-terminal domain-containing protein [uncultured Planococcus sp.]
MTELRTIIKKPIFPIDLVKYSGASGDFNEIHTVPAIAEEKGFADVIVRGMFVMGWAAAAIEEWFPERQLASFNVRFQAVTHPGTVLVITGTMVAENSGEILIKDQQDSTKLMGSFIVKNSSS